MARRRRRHVAEYDIGGAAEQRLETIGGGRREEVELDDRSARTASIGRMSIQ